MVTYLILHLRLWCSKCSTVTGGRRLFLLDFPQSEMAISNIGTIVAALPSSTSAEMTSDPPSAMDSTPQQVRLISMANTFTRILVGPLADYVSPVASYLPNGTIVHARKYRISRVFFLFVSAIILSLTFLWTSIGITTQSGIWLLRCAISDQYYQRRRSTSL